MRYALLALVMALPVALWWQSRRDPAFSPSSSDSQSDWVSQLILLAFTLSVTASVGAAIHSHAPAFVDDAYISYRYSQNLAAGDGLVWNPGDAPLEGFTNLLLVVLMAPVVGVGGDPFIATRILSFLAVLGVALLLYRVAVNRLGIPRTTAYVLALAYPVATTAIPVAMIGLETSLYTYLIFQVFVLALSYTRHRETKRLVWVGVLCFVALLLRPGAVFVLFAIALMLVAQGELRQATGRRALLALGLGFAAPLLVYLLWKQLYFGTIVPNPARIKMVGDGYVRPLGFMSVTGYFLEHWKLLLLAVVSFSLPLRLPFGRLGAGVLMAVYAAFYVGVDTLMDMNHRFLHPVTPFLYLLALPTLAVVVTYLLKWREGALLKIPVTLLVLFSMLFLYSEGPVSYARMAVQQDAMDAGVEGVLLRVGESLAKFPDSQDLTIMSQDAGLVPYLTRARHLDTAGLNNAVIARGGDPMRLADYLFAREPTLIIQRGRKDGQLLDYAHGPLGDQRQWAAHPGWDGYRHLGCLDQPDLHNLHFFVRIEDPRAPALGEYIEAELIEHGPDEVPLVLGSVRAGGS